MHLRPEDFVDLADGARPESLAPHLASCEACRAQLAELRAMMAAAVDADVPEPSPLFWDQLTRRVHDAVAADAQPPSSNIVTRFARLFLGSRVAATSLAAIALVTIASLVTLRTADPTRHVAPPATVAASPAPAPAVDSSNAIETSDVWRDDVWLTFVADLAASVDADAARDEGLDALKADEAVMHLTDAELRELERLLQIQIRNQGD